jgi:3-oxoacyl-[acyl-carrier-protein] synthase-3
MSKPMNQKAIIKACGSYLPERIMTNYELEQLVDTSNEWIIERTGILHRHIAAENEKTSDLAYKAALDALSKGNIDKNDIDLIIVATTTPDTTFPSTAVKVQSLLGLKHGAAFDIQAVCAGFIYALNVAQNFITLGQAKNVLVIGADVMSRILNWNDRSSCILFGDGAGAVILSASESSNQGILESKIYSDGDFCNILYTDGGPSSTGTSGKVVMNGREVFKHAVAKMSDSIEQILSAHNYTAQDIDILVPHQANIRILDAIAKRLNLPAEKVISTVAIHANTSAATIPLALDHALQNNRIKSGDLVVLTALGAGLCWGASLIRWS